MIFFRSIKSSPSIDLNVDEIVPESGSLIERSSTSVANMLDRFRADEVALLRDIDEMTERLRQTRIAITAFEAASGILIGGQADEAPLRRIGRLVPRAVPAAEPMA
ncbi:hypothetical protein [Mesorhizobium neociceri]|uniref:Uncharacterized protein n=1 Tax=Mesorhizobium neociceri TaxID=1307853 RepID=A0A838B6L2_9HYPH|nr:hypothetical protein [Mesorhizobium neociceri]MBA1141722.1 hypothetical protein [Mesorhizobium neociceri]